MENTNYDSDYQIRLATLAEMGGDTTKQYNSVYDIDKEILRLTEEGGGGGNTATISIIMPRGEVKTYQVEKGMTWIDWINSEYNVDGFVYRDFYTEEYMGYAIFETDYDYHLGAVINGVETGVYIPAACTISTSLSYYFYD